MRLHGCPERVYPAHRTGVPAPGPIAGVDDPEPDADAGLGGARLVGGVQACLPLGDGLPLPALLAAGLAFAALAARAAPRVLTPTSSSEDSGVSSSLSRVRSMKSRDRPRRGGVVTNLVGLEFFDVVADDVCFLGDAAAYNGDMKDTPLGALGTYFVSFFGFVVDPFGGVVFAVVEPGADPRRVEEVVEEVAWAEIGRAGLEGRDCDWEGIGPEAVRTGCGCGAGAGTRMWAGIGAGRRAGACVVNCGFGAYNDEGRNDVEVFGTGAGAGRGGVRSTWAVGGLFGCRLGRGAINDLA